MDNYKPHSVCRTHHYRGWKLTASVFLGLFALAPHRFCGAAEQSTDPAAPAPVIVNKPIGLAAYMVTDAKVTPLQYSDIGGMAWLDVGTERQRPTDPKFVILVSHDGTVHKVHVPDLIEERQISLRGHALMGGIAISSEGIVLGVANAQGGSVTVLDSDLNVKRRIDLPGRAGRVDFVAATPKGPLALATGGGFETLLLLDLAHGNIAGHVNAADLAKEHKIFGCNSFPRIAMDIEGKFAFASGGAAVHKFRINGRVLEYMGSTPPLGGGIYDVVISPDSRFVALANGHVRSLKSPKFAFYSDVFRFDDLSTPIAFIGGKPFSNTVAFDLAADLRYSNDNDTQLFVCAADGSHRKDYTLFPKVTNDTWQFLVYPSGRRFLTRTHMGTTGWVELQR